MVQRASCHGSPNTVLPMSSVICEVRVVTGCVMDAGRVGELPITICTASASPAARVMPRTTAVRTPLRAEGIRRCRIVCQRVVPRASEPVRSSCGTAWKAS